MSKKIPMRMCIGCRQMREKREMIRVVRQQDGTFVIDRTGKKNGRGAYLCKNPDCLNTAVKNHGLERSFGMSIPKETVSDLKKEMSELAE
ncbi:MAG: YlxR family protein [Clostridiales bacterium]|nr:YlxR family protein [Clostridiales bacterium]